MTHETVPELNVHERLAIACNNLQVSVALTALVASAWPEHVQANWETKVEGIVWNISREVEEIQGFGEAFDADHEQDA